jgi:hypothetical protein
VICIALTNIDYVDAALCALSARAVLLGKFDVYGNAFDGVIVTPQWNEVSVVRRGSKCKAT